ncbi:MAG: hypothetical protein JJE47_16695 [Acidimicrobiia bacterium]|nr:hypothetical protein [Acidimicrobiia bacterium]
MQGQSNPTLTGFPAEPDTPTADLLRVDQDKDLIESRPITAPHVIPPALALATEMWRLTAMPDTG